jgi:formate dehydrogenase subunit delta
MDIQRLLRMANQIGEFFEAEADRQAALEGIADHVTRFWDPRMRRELLQHLDAHGGEGLKPLVLEALRAHRAHVEAHTSAA